MSFFDILRRPEYVAVMTDAGVQVLQQHGDAFSSGGIAVSFSVLSDRVTVSLTSPNEAIRHVRMRWHGDIPGHIRVLGDHWERGYGDLEWRGIVPERPLPWYFLTSDGDATHGYGVETGGASIAFWQADTAGVALTLDVRNGSKGVQLGARTLTAAHIRTRRGASGESAFASASALCKMLCSSPRLPSHPIYGGNDWYYAYGQNSHQGILGDADRISELSPCTSNRPYMIIDGGWSPNESNAGPWDIGNARFPDMPGLASQIAAKGVRPGIWFRPLTTTSDAPASLLLKPRPIGPPIVLDPTVPEVLQLIETDVRRFRQWGYELIKYDFSTFDIFGYWGSTMGAGLTQGDWTFANRSITTAEAIRGLYRAIADAAGDAVLIGCNTIGHLGAGLFDLQRTGDDTSGRVWERTRKMGINSLAFRMPQHEAFYLADADCVGLTTAIPWSLNRQWLDLLARSGTPLFVSLSPDALGAEQAAALKDAFHSAASPQPPAEPLDWLDTTCPASWRLGNATVHFDWSEPGGASPYFHS
ncbi:MAG: hypothetical protein P4L33_00190 [Capsulimonadaceae bacterium]|nr:hypothetical protein [Capsulimonadaceae bacterium]